MSSFDEHTKHIQEQFNRQSNDYAKTAQARDMRGMKSLVRLTKLNKSSHALDVACGPGRLTMALATQAQQATGLDVTENLLSIGRREAQESGLKNIEFKLGSALDMPFSEGAFDVVSCRAAFHHFAKPAQVLKEMVRVVRQSGEILIADILGHEDDATAVNHDMLERLCDPTHVRCLSKSRYQFLFKNAGLEVTDERLGSMDYVVDEWLVHGGQAESRRNDIRRIFQKNAESDETGLLVREEGGVLKFTHQTVVFVLKATADA